MGTESGNAETAKPTPKVKRAVLLSRPPSPHEKQLNRLTNVPQGRNDDVPQTIPCKIKE